MEPRLLCFRAISVEYKEKVDDANPIVYEHILREDKVAIAANPYLKFDPALEHFENIVYHSRLSFQIWSET
jgi:hypothetical protein